MLATPLLVSKLNQMAIYEKRNNIIIQSQALSRSLVHDQGSASINVSAQGWTKCINWASWKWRAGNKGLREEGHRLSRKKKETYKVFRVSES